MLKIATLFVLFLVACGPQTGEDEKEQSKARRQRSIDSSNPPTGPTNTNPPPRPKAPGPLTAQELQQFNTDFAAKFAGAKSLPTDHLAKIIKAVPSQTSTWGCGLIQASMALASARLNKGEDIKADELGACNVMFFNKSYPLLAEISISEADWQKVSAIPQVQTLLQGVSFEMEVGFKFFRVGALPNRLANEYLKTQLPGGINAKYVASDSLDPEELIALVDENLAIKMPLIILFVPNAEKMQMHYVSIVGYSLAKDQLLVLDTTKDGVDRLSLRPTQKFIEGMNTVKFKQKLTSVIPQIEQFQSAATAFGITINGALPKVTALDEIKNYNMVSFAP